MNNQKSNNLSAGSLKRDNLDFDDPKEPQNQQKHTEFFPSSKLRHSNHDTVSNPYMSKLTITIPSEQQIVLQTKQQSPLKNSSSIRLSKPSFVNAKTSFQFPGNSKQKQSAEFMFGSNLSGSLFGSENSQKQNERGGKSKNLQNLISLLKEQYNEGYMKSNYRSIRKSSLALHKSSIRRSQLPFFIIREPIFFQKKYYGFRSGYDLSGNFMCRLVDNKIYYKNILNEELQNLEEIKCEYIQLPEKQNPSPSLEIDSSSMHLFYYSNTTNEIVVLSLSKLRKNKNKEICRIKTRTQRSNPLLYLIEINKQTILLLIGGYIPFNSKAKSEEVEGCKFIQIFPIDKWGTGIMESRVIKLINGKIYPLVIFPVKIQLNDSLLLIGGNTMAKITGSKLSFKDYKVINRSSNVRGVFINTKNIIECIQKGKDIMSLPNGNNISVQIQDKVNLYNGYVDYLKMNHKEKIRLFLPKMKQFYTLKILKKEVRIIQSKQNQQRVLTFNPSEEYQHLEMKCFKKPTIKYYQITSKGVFQQKKIELSNNDSFGIRKEFRCPCEFM